MRTKLLQILACPKCKGKLSCEPTNVGADGEVETGALGCAGCGASYEISNGIPRFIESDNYASSFGYQWNRFKAEQIDSTNGTRLSEKRFYAETNWSRDWLRGKWILDAGCGAGRFLDVASKSECEVVGVDISNATDAARANLANRANVHLVQASIYELPFQPGAFEGCYCIGVIQHTPDPAKALEALPAVLADGGRLAVTIYERRRATLMAGKYLIRPLTKRLNQKFLLISIRVLMPVLFAVTEVLFRIPVFGQVFSFLIPVANYVGAKELTMRQRYDWAVLDTFDMLAPQFDQPQTEADATRALIAGGLEQVERLKNPGLNLAGKKAAESVSEGKQRAVVSARMSGSF
jgi:2-polyprenyl-3-methyl-5-hydroxy-6-metoxy-1,4-benzoquinol methylase